MVINDEEISLQQNLFSSFFSAMVNTGLIVMLHLNINFDIEKEYRVYVRDRI